MNHANNERPISYAGYRFPSEVISYAVWLYFRVPLSLRMVEEMLAARSIDVTYETVRRWALKFGQQIAKNIRLRPAAFGDKWHWTRSLCVSMDATGGCGVLSTNMERFWMCWCRVGATDRPQGMCSTAIRRQAHNHKCVKPCAHFPIGKWTARMCLHYSNRRSLP